MSGRVAGERTTVTEPESGGPPSPRPRPARLRAAVRRIPAALRLLLLVAALQTVAWDLALPPFQGPDEDAHFAYVQHLAETGHIPRTSGGGTAGYSTAQYSLMNALNLLSLRGDLSARPAWSSADLALWHQVQRALPPGASDDGYGPTAVATNPPLYYALMAVPYRLVAWLPLLKRLFVLRLVGALFFLATVICTWLLAGELFGPVRWKQTLAAGAVALEPQLAFTSAIVNTDGLLVALMSGFMLLAVRLVSRGPSWPRVLGATVLAAAAMLTHGRGLVALPVLATALVVAWIRHRPPIRDVLVRGASAAALLALAFLAMFGVSQSGGAGGALYGGQVSALNRGTFSLTQFLSNTVQFYVGHLPGLPARLGPPYGFSQVFIHTFYGTFGWLEVVFVPRVYHALEILSGLGLIGFLLACIARGRRLVQRWGEVLVLGALLVTQLFFLHYVSYRALVSNGGSDPVVVGRYLLPMVTLFGLAIAFTVGALPRRTRPYVASMILAVGVLLSLAGIGITAGRFYV